MSAPGRRRPGMRQVVVDLALHQGHLLRDGPGELAWPLRTRCSASFERIVTASSARARIARLRDRAGHDLLAVRDERVEVVDGRPDLGRVAFQPLFDTALHFREAGRISSIGLSAPDDDQAGGEERGSRRR